MCHIQEMHGKTRMCHIQVLRDHGRCGKFTEPGPQLFRSRLAQCCALLLSSRDKPVTVASSEDHTCTCLGQPRAQVLQLHSCYIANTGKSAAVNCGSAFISTCTR